MGKNKTKTQTEKPEKAFNRLPLEFQWTEGLDVDHIFPQEREMIVEFRKHFGSEIDYWSDKMVLYFLFARRDQVITLAFSSNTA